MEDAVLGTLAASGTIENSLAFAKAHDFALEPFDGVLKSLVVDNYIVLTNLEKDQIQLTAEGEQVLKSGTPEYRMVALLKVGEEKTREELEKQLGKDVVQIASGKAMANKWITSTKTTVKRIVEDIKDETAAKLAIISKDLDPSKYEGKLLQELKKRKMIAVGKIKFYKITKGSNFQAKRMKEAVELTEEMLANKTWQGLKFKQLNHLALGKEITTGNFHPLLVLRDQFRGILLELGFEEMPTNSYVETSFWNFDVLFTAQQHPARDMQDTFFLAYPELCNTIPAELEGKIKKAHEGGDYGSLGYRYDWKEAEAKKNIMRTHTTPCSAKMLYKLAEETKKSGKFKPKKYFSIDRVFRNEATDATHLYEFHQVEGLIADYGMNLKNLMAIISEFFTRLGISNIKFKPAFNPYTEPSMEVFGFHPILKKMVEVGNSGIFRPEMLLPLGLPEGVNVIAWGLSLERPAMINYHIDNIRDLLGSQVPLKFVEKNPIYCLK